mmetsp:Transcript_17906/g.39331  ORF Transcript_17906/g.39331 Transcript_17906/m.39331 type:complete len:504 (-) Transcript_17906:156-1667(-)
MSQRTSIEARAGSGHSNERPKLESVIESLGVGPANLIMMTLALGVWVADGVELTFTVALMPAISDELALGPSQRATLAALVFMGLFVGSSTGGYLGDTIGRRIPILVSYAGVTLVQLLCSCVTAFGQLAALRLALGAAMGFSMPAALALAIEVCPVEWRIPMQGFRGVIFMLGNVIGASAIYLDNPDLESLNWRLLLAFGALPPAVLGLLAFFFMPESPVFLAAAGRGAEAQSVLAWMRLSNGRNEASLDYRPVPVERRLGAIGSGKWSYESRLVPFKVIFGRHLCYPTVALMVVTFTINFVEYGTAYAEPVIFSSLQEGRMPAGQQLLMKYSVAVVLRTFMLLPAMFLSRTMALMSGLAIIAMGLMMFVVNGEPVDPEKEPGWTLIFYQMALYLQVMGLGLAVLPALLLIVEIYPPVMAATGSSVSLSGGRMGSVLCPYIFETFRGHWQYFYFLLTGSCILAIVLVFFVPDPKATLKDAEADLTLVAGETDHLMNKAFEGRQ